MRRRHETPAVLRRAGWVSFPVVELSLAPTKLTEWGEITILGDAADTLPALADRVEALLG